MFGIERVQISKTAWHYRWLKRIHFISEWTEYDYGREVEFKATSAPKSICPYFWLLMGSFGLLTLISLACLGLMGGLVYLVYFLILQVINHPFEAFKGILILASIGSIIGLLYIYVNKPQKPKEKKPKKPNTGLGYVVKNYLSARKNKICPLIEFTD